jgi:hypothetical protein
VAVSRYASERYPDAAAQALGAIALGQSIADTLQAQNRSMSRAVAVQFARTVGSSAAARELRQAAPQTAAAAGIPADRVQVDLGLPVPSEYTVIYVITDADGTEHRIPVVIQSLPAGATEAQIIAAADDAAALLLPTDISPVIAEGVEAAQEAGSVVEETIIVRARINPTL